MKPINIFYEEPDSDRWIKYDRYIRKIIRRIVRGAPRPGGQMLVALNLLQGLDKLGIPYRFNDYKYAKNNPKELIGVIGKDHLILEKKFKNPILFGASIGINPYDNPTFFDDNINVKELLVPGEWLKALFSEKYPVDKITCWPVGINTCEWNKDIKKSNPTTDFLIYDKIRWEHTTYEKELINPIIEELGKQNLSYDIIKYGYYKPKQLKTKISNCKAVIFLCEHETQGIAYQQILASGTPILAWDRGGYWRDPSFFPNKIKFQPVSSVPYWDENCGEKFKNIDDFNEVLKLFRAKLEGYNPSTYILENLTLEKAAQSYYNIYDKLKNSH